MANRYVRLYSNPTNREKSTLLGFSMSAADVDPSSNAEWQDFLTENEYTARELVFSNKRDLKQLKRLAGVSFRYFEITPPLTDEHLPAVARLCAEQVDPYHNQAYLIDNRETPSPFKPFDLRGTIVARW